MWVDDKPIDDGYRSLYTIRIHVIHVFESFDPCSYKRDLG